MTNLEPGRELDAWLAVHLLGYRWFAVDGQDWASLLIPEQAAMMQPQVLHTEKPERGEITLGRLPELSTTWEGMRLVCEAMTAQEWQAELRIHDDHSLAGFHRRGICRRMKFKHAPGAVALAAKAAIGG